MIFNTVDYLMFEKNKSELDPDLLEAFHPFITTKWFSFYDSGKYCGYINDTLNMYSGIFSTKEEEFKFFDHLIPKLKRRRSEYIKKEKIQKPLEEVQHIPEFLSRREIEMYDGRTN